MKQIIFELIYICLGIIALCVRISSKVDTSTIYYMSVINQIAGFVTLIMILYHAINNMVKHIKDNGRSLKRLNAFVIFSISIIFIYWIVILVIYQKFNAADLNDVLTIVTLTIALTDDLWSNILQAIFYKR